MKLKVAKILGLNTDQKAAQVISSLREDSSFFAVLKLTSDDAFTKGRQILSELEDFYFDTEGETAQKLNETFKEAENKLSEGSKYDLILGAVNNKVLYFLGKGEAEIYLKRGDKLSPLFSIGSSPQLVSGFLQDSDKILFSTKSFSSLLKEDLEKSLNLPIEMFEEEVGSKIGLPDLEKKEEEAADMEQIQAVAALVVEVLEEDVAITQLSSKDSQHEIEQQESRDFDSGVSVKSESPLAILLSKIRGIFRFLRQYFPKSGRSRLIVAALLFIIVAGGILYQYKLTSDREKQTQFTQVLKEARDDFNTAKGLASLSPGDAKSKLDSAKQKIEQALSLKPQNNDAQNLKKQINDESASILQQAEVGEFPIFLDMDLVKKNFRTNSLSFSAGKLLLLDPGVGTLVAIDVAKKSNQILAGKEQLGDASLASLNGGLAFVYSKDKGVLRIDTTNSKLTTVAKPDSDLGEIKDIFGFANNVYILDSEKNLIWKYLPTTSGYTDKREYFSEGTKADLSSTLRMQIESSIYVLKQGGEILRFTKGNKDNFSYSGLPSNVKDPKNIFVSSDTDKLYVLDSGNSRILILDKTGVYKGQITGAKFGVASDLAVDEKGKKIYLLEGGKIYSVDLK